jgi:cytochrome c-type biogenesis protein CcmH
VTEALGRRAFFAVAAAAAGAVIQDTVRAGRVYDPDRAGRAQAPITAADNDKSIQVLEKKLRCSCGCGLDVYTCRTTDFACTYSPALHKQVLALLGDGKTPQEVMDAFVVRYGQVALMSPPRRGFNLLGYFVPGLVLVVAAAVVVVLLSRWTRPARVVRVSPNVPPDATPAELEQLRRELDNLPG